MNELNNLTDLEICKRVALIDANIALCSNSTTIKDTVSHVHDENTDGYNLQYNPLEDDALAFQLMIKYDITFDFFTDEGKKIYYGWVEKDCFNYEVPDAIGLNRYICYAIITLMHS